MDAEKYLYSVQLLKHDSYTMVDKDMFVLFT